MKRRNLILGGAAMAGMAAARAAAAPVLSAANYGLTPRLAARRNGWIEVDAAAFEANVATLRAAIGRVRLCAVMKADAYGNGIALLMPSVIKLGITDVAITSNDEARVARALDYRGRLLRIRTATPDEMDDGLRFGIEELIGNPDAAAGLARLARGRKLRVHLALNSGGMSRNGLELSTPYGKADAQALLSHPSLHVVGAMTHYPSEDADDILGQLNRFNADLAWLRGAGLIGPSIIRHTANTFATLQHPATRLDMVRVGGALYGDPGSVKTTDYRLVPAIKSQVAAVGHFPAGQSVNYDRIFRLDRESWLANIPIGYSDGIRRGLSHANRDAFPAEAKNHSAMLIRGEKFPIVGRVTMNTLMIDVTGAQDRIRIGDEVVLFGSQGGQTINQAEFEANSSAYAPEMLAMLGATMPKVLKPRH